MFNLKTPHPEADPLTDKPRYGTWEEGFIAEYGERAKKVPLKVALSAFFQYVNAANRAYCVDVEFKKYEKSLTDGTA